MVHSLRWAVSVTSAHRDRTPGWVTRGGGIYFGSRFWRIYTVVTVLCTSWQQQCVVEENLVVDGEQKEIYEGTRVEHGCEDMPTLTPPGIITD